MKTIVSFVFVLGALSAAGEVILGKRGQKVTLVCGVKSFSASLEWSREGDLILSEKFRGGMPIRASGTGNIVGRSKLRLITNLEISDVMEEDAGKFVCSADGRRHEHTLLVISVSVSASPSAELQLGSEATLQCQVKDLDPDSAVRWTRPDGSPHSGSQIVQLKPVTRSDAGRWWCTISHQGGTYNDSLVIKVHEPAPITAAPLPPGGPKGDQRPTCPDCVTHPPPTALLLGLSWWVWVAVGVGGLVLVLLMVSVILMCRRIKRMKRKSRMMKNVRQPLASNTYCQCDRATAAAAKQPQRGRRREKPSAPPLLLLPPP